MKKRILIGLLVAAIAVMSFSAMCFASPPPSVVTVTWDGGGTVGGTVDTGATVSTFTVSAGAANGSFTATDSNDNPYGYGVDTNSAYINGTISNGYMQFQTDRVSSYVPMYGVAGQSIFNFVGSSGTGAMATGSSTNYAAMGNGTYGKPHTTGGFNFEANAGSGTYQVLQTISAIEALAQFVANGSGTVKINSMTTEAAGTANVNLGWGGGCYTNATMLATGAGDFTATAIGKNSVTTPIAGASGAMVAGGWNGIGNGTYGSVALNTVMTFANGASVGNFSVKVQ